MFAKCVFYKCAFAKVHNEISEEPRNCLLYCGQRFHRSDVVETGLTVVNEPSGDIPPGLVKYCDSYVGISVPPHVKIAELKKWCLYIIFTPTDEFLAYGDYFLFDLMYLNGQKMQKFLNCNKHENTI